MVLISSKCTISIRHGSNFGPTWAHLAQISAQLGSNMAQLGPGSNFAPSLSPHALKMGAHGRPITKTLNTGIHWYVPFFPSMMLVLSNVPNVVSPVGPTWCEAVAKVFQTVACWASMRITLLQFEAQPDQLGLQLGPR